MATVDQVLTAIRDAVYDLLVGLYGDNPPAQIGIGFPYAPSLSEILGEGEAQISVYPLSKAAQNRTSRKPFWKTSVQNPVTLIVTKTVSGSNFHLTFSGTAAGGLNIHTFIQPNTVDAYYATQNTDSLNSIATAVAAAITALSVPGVTASASGAVVTVSGTPYLKCNIGGTSVMVQEVRRAMLPVQLSVWAPDAASRQAIGALIENGFALDFPIPFLNAADGSAIWIRQRSTPAWSDDSQRSYSLYEWHCIYECEFPTLQSATGAQIESVGTQIGSGSIEYTGG